MQSLDIISVNVWQMLASLLNLVLLFLVIKRFLYRPVKKMLAARQSAIEGDYDAAREAKQRALDHQKAYEEKLGNAQAEAEEVIQSAVSIASQREKEMLRDAKKKAEGILRQAEVEAELERKKAEEGIKKQIVEISSLLTEKVLEREVSLADHHKLIESFLNEVGERDAD